MTSASFKDMEQPRYKRPQLAKMLLAAAFGLLLCTAALQWFVAGHTGLELSLGTSAGGFVLVAGLMLVVAHLILSSFALVLAGIAVVRLARGRRESLHTLFYLSPLLVLVAAGTVAELGACPPLSGCFAGEVFYFGLPIKMLVWGIYIVKYILYLA